MNIAHWRYAVEVEKTRSISKAAENLFMGQPNLSRAIKELEESLGITIFQRTSKGISVTVQGQEFLYRAKRILMQVDEMEALYQTERSQKLHFGISVPRASYVACAFTAFVEKLDPSRKSEIYYKETNAHRAIENIEQNEYSLGIVRYQTTFEKYFAALLREKDMVSEVMMEFTYLAVVSRDHPLAGRESITPTDLCDCIEIAHADPYVPSLSPLDVRKAELSGYVDRHVYVFERGSQFDLLTHVPGSFMWVSPIPQRLLAQYNLVQIPCKKSGRRYRDVLVCRNGYQFSKEDNLFLEELQREIKALGEL